MKDSSNLVVLFSVLAMEKCSSTKVIEIISRYFNSIKYFRQIPEKRNKCIVLSCFRRASTVAFNTAQPSGKRISNSNKEEGQMLPPATLLQKVRRTRLFRQLEWWRGPTAQDTIQAGAQPGAVGKINAWASPSPLPLRLVVCKWLWPWWFRSQNRLHVATLAFCLDSRKSVYRRLNTMKKWKTSE